MSVRASCRLWRRDIRSVSVMRRATRVSTGRLPMVKFSLRMERAAGAAGRCLVSADRRSSTARWWWCRSSRQSSAEHAVRRHIGPSTARSLTPAGTSAARTHSRPTRRRFSSRLARRRLRGVGRNDGSDLPIGCSVHPQTRDPLADFRLRSAPQRARELFENEPPKGHASEAVRP